MVHPALQFYTGPKKTGPHPTRSTPPNLPNQAHHHTHPKIFFVGPDPMVQAHTLTLFSTLLNSRPNQENRPTALDGLDGSDIDHAITHFLGKLTKIARNHHGFGFIFGNTLGLEIIFKTASPHESHHCQNHDSKNKFSS